MNTPDTLQFFLQAPLSRCLDLLRAKLLLETLERDEQGYLTCYCDKNVACAAAERARCDDANAQGLCLSAANGNLLVIITVRDPEVIRLLQPVSPTVVLWNRPQGMVSLSPAAQQLLSDNATFTMEAIPGPGFDAGNRLVDLTNNGNGADDEDGWF